MNACRWWKHAARARKFSRKREQTWRTTLRKHSRTERESSGAAPAVREVYCAGCSGCTCGVSRARGWTGSGDALQMRPWRRFHTDQRSFPAAQFRWILSSSCLGALLFNRRRFACLCALSITNAPVVPAGSAFGLIRTRPAASNVRHCALTRPTSSQLRLRPTDSRRVGTQIDDTIHFLCLTHSFHNHG